MTDSEQQVFDALQRQNYEMNKTLTAITKIINNEHRRDKDKVVDIEILL